jgi:hypothetical protein
MYREYIELRDTMKWPLPDDKVIYSIPWKEKSPDEYAKQYRGVCRDPLFPWNERDEEIFSGSGEVVEPIDSELKAHLAVGQLDKDREPEGGNIVKPDEGDIIKAHEDALRVFGLLEPPIEREVLWFCNVESDPRSQPDYPLLGYEPALFGGDWFSAISDCLCFPIWHGTDTEGELFREHHERLNDHALFDTPDAARDFLDYYRSFDWTETGDYIITEVKLVNMNMSNKQLNSDGLKPAG